MESKYFKPKSLAWWASVAPLFAGVFLAWSDTMQAGVYAAQILRSMAGDMTPSQLVQLGLLGIGLRGANG